MPLVMSIFVNVHSSCFVGLQILMVNIEFLTVTVMTCPSNSMYLSPFSVLL